MLRDGAGIRVEAVERNQSRDPGKKSKQDIESQTCRKGKDSILAYAVVDAKSDILPALGRDLGGSRRSAASVSLGRHGLARRAVINGPMHSRFFGALGPGHTNNTEERGRRYGPKRSSPRFILHCCQTH